MRISNERDTIEYFLSFDLASTDSVFDEFAQLKRAEVHLDGGKTGFIYVPGTRKDRVVLCAHADTFWDSHYKMTDHIKHELVLKDGKYSGTSNIHGIGADDRAGCALLWLLRESGHSLLILDGEEHGQVGSHNLTENYPSLFHELNDHSYMIQFDRCGSNDYKCYDLPVTKEFTDYIENNMSYVNAGNRARTDIVVLCNKICGVNLSVGYYNEHKQNEFLSYDEWINTYLKVKDLLAGTQPRFPLFDAAR